MSRTVAVANEKGGVGKSTSVINLAYAAAQAGLVSLVVDIDPQCNATTGLGVDPETAQLGMYEVLAVDPKDRVKAHEAVVKTEFGVLLIPGSKALAAIARHGAGPGGETLLALQLSKLARPVDLILIDCPPSLGHLTVMGLLAADAVAGVLKPGYDEIKGIAELMDTIDTVNANSMRATLLKIDHVLVTMYDGRTQLAKDVVAKVREMFPTEYLGEIRSTVRVPEAASRRTPVMVDSPNSTAALDYKAIGARFVERVAA